MKPQAFEARIRRHAQRVGLQLRKSRVRSEDDPTYGLYHLVDVRLNAVVFGSHHFAHEATLEDCGDFLNS